MLGFLTANFSNWANWNGVNLRGFINARKFPPWASGKNTEKRLWGTSKWRDGFHAVRCAWDDFQAGPGALLAAPRPGWNPALQVF